MASRMEEQGLLDYFIMCTDLGYDFMQEATEISCNPVGLLFLTMLADAYNEHSNKEGQAPDLDLHQFVVFKERLSVFLSIINTMKRTVMQKFKYECLTTDESCSPFDSLLQLFWCGKEHLTSDTYL